MPTDASPPEIFDRKRRRGFRERAKRRGSTAFLWEHIADELAERLLDVSRTFSDVLIVGPISQYADRILNGRPVMLTSAALSNADGAPSANVVEEDRLPFPPANFDLVIAAGTLDSVNDLPGALVQIRRCLRPDGLFLGHMFGAGTLVHLKSAMLEAHQGAASPHIHPQIDLRTAADLLNRAGFALPVADKETMTVRYGDWRRLKEDLRDMGVGNALAGPRAYLGRTFAAQMDAAWQQRAADDGKVDERFVHIHMSGWSPSADQPKPAKRGSGEVSLATFLQSKPTTG